MRTPPARAPPRTTRRLTSRRRRRIPPRLFEPGKPLWPGPAAETVRAGVAAGTCCCCCCCCCCYCCCGFAVFFLLTFGGACRVFPLFLSLPVVCLRGLFGVGSAGVHARSGGGHREGGPCQRGNRGGGHCGRTGEGYQRWARQAADECAELEGARGRRGGCKQGRVRHSKPRARARARARAQSSGRAAVRPGAACTCTCTCSCGVGVCVSGAFISGSLHRGAHAVPHPRRCRSCSQTRPCDRSPARFAGCGRAARHSVTTVAVGASGAAAAAHRPGWARQRTFVSGRQAQRGQWCACTGCRWSNERRFGGGSSIGKFRHSLVGGLGAVAAERPRPTVTDHAWV